MGKGGKSARKLTAVESVSYTPRTHYIVQDAVHCTRRWCGTQAADGEATRGDGAATARRVPAACSLLVTVQLYTHTQFTRYTVLGLVERSPPRSGGLWLYYKRKEKVKKMQGPVHLRK